MNFENCVVCGVVAIIITFLIVCGVKEVTAIKIKADVEKHVSTEKVSQLEIRVTALEKKISEKGK